MFAPYVNLKIENKTFIGGGLLGLACADTLVTNLRYLAIDKNAKVKIDLADTLITLNELLDFGFDGQLKPLYEAIPKITKEQFYSLD